MKLRVGVLASGQGSNFAALLRAAAADGYPAAVVALASNRPAAPVLKLGEAAGISTGVFPGPNFVTRQARDEAMGAFLRAHAVRLVVCAGYDQILSDAFVHAFPQAVLNVHPALLPAFGGGMDAPRRALEHGVRISGCTVHLIEGSVDQGPIVLQVAVDVHDDDTPASLHARIQREEHRLLPEAVRLFAEDRLQRDGRRIRILPARVGVA